MKGKKPASVQYGSGGGGPRRRERWETRGFHQAWVQGSVPTGFTYSDPPSGIPAESLGHSVSVGSYLDQLNAYEVSDVATQTLLLATHPWSMSFQYSESGKPRVVLHGTY